MDTQKMITAIFLIAVAVGAVGAVAFIVIDGTQGGDDSEKVDFSDCVVNTFKENWEVGDYFDRTTTNPDGTKVTERTTIKSMDNANKTAVLTITKNGVSADKTIKRSEIMNYFTLDYVYLNPPNVMMPGLHKVDTVYGPVKCYLYSGTSGTAVNSYYVGTDNRVCYLYTVANAVDTSVFTSVALTDTSIFQQRPGQLPVDPSKPVDPNNPVTPADPSKKVKDSVEVKDFIEFTYPVSPDKTAKDRYTVTAIDKDTGNLTVSNTRNGVTNTVVMTQKDFMDMLVPVLGGAVLDTAKSPQNLKTVWGDISVNVYYVSVPIGTNEKIDRQLFVDASGVLFKTVEIGEVTDNEGDKVKWTESFTLSDTSMLEGYKKPTA